MFDPIVNEAASRFGLPTTSVSAVAQGLLSLLTNERSGGPEGFLDLFRRAGLGDVITSWFGGKEGRPITPSHLESALGTGTIDTLAASSGLTRTVVSAAAAFMLPKLIGWLTPNGMFPSGAALRSQIANHTVRSAIPPVEPRMARAYDRRAGWPSWLPWAAAAALALAASLWMRSPTGTLDPQLTVTNRDGRVTYSGVVHNETEQTAIVEALRTTFGAANIDGNLLIDRNVRRASWLPRVGDLFAALKASGADISLNGDRLRLGGWLSAVDREALTGRLHGILGTRLDIASLGDAAVDAVRTANDKALSALGAMTAAVTPEAVVQAMNLSVINFATGSDQIPVDSAEVIRKSAEAIKRSPPGSKIEIGGHTDNTGDSASNMALSQARADAVKHALVAAGVSGDVLAAKGYGDTRPRATNDTEFGRFQNRRIEYAVVTTR